MSRKPEMRLIAGLCVALIVALWTVGIEASQPIRHFIQTSPIWIAVVLALRGDSVGKWVGLPFFLFWLLSMLLIWLFLLGWAHVITGRFTRIEIVLTLLIGAVSFAGAIGCIRLKSLTGWFAATALFIVSLTIQLAALRVSMLPGIAHR
jgi:hypothetical protein